MQETHRYVIGVHNSVRLVNLRNALLRQMRNSVIKVHSCVTLVIPTIFFVANFAM